MTLATVRFGVIDVPVEDVYEVTTPIPGFPDTKNFVFLQKEEIVPFSWIQSMQDPGQTLLVVEPRHFFRYYNPDILGFDLKDVGASGMDEVVLYVIVMLPDDIEKMTANLRRPLIVNRKTGQMKQIRWSLEKYSFTESIVAGIRRGETAKADLHGLNGSYEVYLN